MRTHVVCGRDNSRGCTDESACKVRAPCSIASEAREAMPLTNVPPLRRPRGLGRCLPNRRVTFLPLSGDRAPARFAHTNHGSPRVSCGKVYHTATFRPIMSQSTLKDVKHLVATGYLCVHVSETSNVPRPEALQCRGPKGSLRQRFIHPLDVSIPRVAVKALLL